MWRAMAEVAEKTVKKGSQLYIVGKIKTRSYVDKEGNNKYITEILADTFLVLDKKPSAPASGEAAGSVQVTKEPEVPEVQEKAEDYQTAGGDDDDLPF
jgi:single-strand DNA-binding protein